MEKSEKETMFEKYVKMIQKKAWEVHNMTGCEYKELEAHGYLIYCEALETWNPEKGSFSTHLSNRLMLLGCHPKYDLGYEKGRKIDELDEISENNLESRYNNPSLCEILNLAKEILTTTAYNIIKWILERSWESDSVHKPNISLCCRTFNLQRKEVEVAWNEIKDFWKNEGTFMFA